MLAIIFVIVAVINAIMLFGLFGAIYLKSKELDNKEINTDKVQILDKYEDILVISLLAGITLVILLSVFIII